MDPTTRPVVVHRRCRKRRPRHMTLATAGPRVGIQLTIDGGPDGSWTRWLTPHSADELLAQLTLDIDRLAERLWGP
jgi:hypothetical protein